MIHELLLEGKENALSGKMLCRLTGLHPRELTQQIFTERQAGEPICARTDGTHPGYYLAEDRGTMLAYIASLRHRIAETEQTLKACQKTLEKLPVKRIENGFSEDELISDPAGCFGQLLDETFRSLAGEDVTTLADDVFTVMSFLGRVQS